MQPKVLSSSPISADEIMWVTRGGFSSEFQPGLEKAFGSGNELDSFQVFFANGYIMIKDPKSHDLIWNYCQLFEFHCGK